LALSNNDKSFDFNQARRMKKYFQDLIDDEDGPIVCQGVFRDNL